MLTFVSCFLPQLQFGPHHLYASALSLCPRNTHLWSLYHTKATVPFYGDVLDTWSGAKIVIHTLVAVTSVAFSPDGSRLASGDVKVLPGKGGTMINVSFDWQQTHQNLCGISNALYGHVECRDVAGNQLALGFSSGRVLFLDLGFARNLPL